ncbi:MAG: PAS domain S-box protein [Candidatus Aminicenantes bacterium]|nr:PAS domain S-box protein [Candidatus Aminicenantes bacterium]
MKKKQILIVEDERVVGEDIKMSVERLGYAVSGITFSGEDAVKKAEDLHPDLVMMDIVLENKMNGIEAAEIIRSRHNIPVVYLTAYADNKTIEKAKATEPYGYILKPFEDRDLHATIEMALYKHKIENMLKESEEKYRSLAENAYDAIYISSKNGFLYVNPAFEKLTGWKNEEICGEEFNFWNKVHPEDLELIKEREKARKAGKEVPPGNEFRIIAKDKAVKIVEANTVNIGKKEETKEIGILRDITVRKKAEEELKKSLEKLQKTFEETINALVSALERRDPYTAGHQKRVTNMACAIAEEMGFSKDQITGLRLAGLIHDVGKIQIPIEILIKPTHLSEVEFVMIKMHPQVGYEILKSIEFPFPVAQIVLQHHERMDGSGYPEGISGEEILPEARVLAVADVVEAMSSHRPYRPALGISTALREITKYRGSLYDPEVVDTCWKLFNKNKLNYD